MPPGTLRVVATPLGNLEDLSPRALAALRRASLVACEDTRRTRKLLSHFGVSPPRVISSHKFNERRQLEPILAELREGRDVALVSDGGTPGVSDPGAFAVQAALEEGLPVSPIPGPSAAAAAISASGFPASSFLFAGFLPARGGARREAIASLAGETRPIVLFEAPHRVAATARDLLEALGDRPVTLLREMTKMHEEVRRSSLSELAARLASEEPRGEFTLVIRGRDPRDQAAREEPPTPDELRASYRRLLQDGVDHREALKRLAKEAGLPRREVYAAVKTGRP